MLPLMVIAGALFGMVWAAVPAYLQAYRGSHIVITTIMFNFLASSLLVYLLVNHMKVPGSMAVESAVFGASAKMPSMHTFMAGLGVDWPNSPLNTSLFWHCLRRSASTCCCGARVRDTTCAPPAPAPPRLPTQASTPNIRS